MPEAEVAFVDTVVPPRSHDHEAAADDSGPAAASAAPGVSGRSRQNKLVHVTGGPDLVGRTVRVRVEHAGPYSLRGAVLAG